jgi:2-methylcitrate dehydratase PrpD
MSRKVNRRQALWLAGGALAMSTRRVFADEPAISPMMTILSGYMAGAANRALPEDVIEKTKQAILDTLAAMVSGSELPPGKFVVKFAQLSQGKQVATVVASPYVIGTIDAAMCNAMLAHSDETDDTHPPSQSHPGAAVVPAALAVGEQFSIDGNRFLRAVALGYDIGPRMTITLGKLQYQVEAHRSTHSLSGTFGAAAAASCAAGLNAQQMRWMLSYTSQEAGGIASWQRDTDHIEKAFDFVGAAARDGVTATLLVQAGATGVDDVFSGPDNFFLAFGPKNSPEMMIEKLGERYEVMRTNFKKWTVGAPIQAPLDALSNLMAKHHFTADQVKQVTIRVATDEAGVVDNRIMPDICLQHLIAVMLLDGTVSFKSAHDVERMKNPAVLRERAKVSLVKDDGLEKLMPKRVAVVEVTLGTGQTVSERVEAVRGTVENPMTRDEVIAKAKDLMIPVLGTTTTGRLIDGIFHLEQVKNIRELRPLLQKA